MNSEDGVTVFDGSSRLILTRIGEAESGYPATSYPTRIQVRSGPFSASVEAAAQNYANFRKALLKFHETLGGEARLEFWNQEHSVILTGRGKGDVQLVAKITDGRSPWSACLTVRMVLNQSYLRQIIAEIDRHFPEAA